MLINPNATVPAGSTRTSQLQDATAPTDADQIVMIDTATTTTTRVAVSELKNQFVSSPENAAAINAAIVNAVNAQNQKAAVDTADITTNVSISSAPASIGGLAMSGGATKRVLLLGLTNIAARGVYIWTATGSPMVRASDLDAWPEFVNASVYVSGGTYAGKQYRCTVGAIGALGTDPITWKEDTAVTLADTNESYVSTSGLDTGNGSIAAPYRTVTAALGRSGISAPHIFHLQGQTFGGWTQTQVNQTFGVKDPIKTAGKTTVTSPITLPAGKYYAGLVGLTFSSDAAIVIAAGNLGGNKIERCSWSNAAAMALWSLDPAASGYVSLRAVDATGSPLAVAVIPDMTSTPNAAGVAFTINLAEVETRFPFLVGGPLGASTVLINIAKSCEQDAPRIPAAFKGKIYWSRAPFSGQLTGVISTQADLTALLADTSGTDAVPRYYLINFGTPTLFAQGAIIGKQSAGGFTENFWIRDYAQAPTEIYNLGDGRTWMQTGSLTWAPEGTSSGIIPTYTLANRPAMNNSEGYCVETGVEEFLSVAKGAVPQGPLVINGVRLDATNPSGANVTGLWLNNSGSAIGANFYQGSVAYWNGAAWEPAYEFGNLPSTVTAGGAVYQKYKAGWVAFGSTVAQHVRYVRNSSMASPNGATIICPTVETQIGSGITLDPVTGYITIKDAGSYILEGIPGEGWSTDGQTTLKTQFFNITAGGFFGGNSMDRSMTSGSWNPASGTPARANLTITGPTVIAYCISDNNSASSISNSGQRAWIEISQIAAPAVVPTADNRAGAVTNKLTEVAIDNIRARFDGSPGATLEIATVSGTATVSWSTLAVLNGAAVAVSGEQTLTTSWLVVSGPSQSTSAGDRIEVLVTDKTNGRLYRVTGMVTAAYTPAPIVIERLV